MGNIKSTLNCYITADKLNLSIFCLHKNVDIDRGKSGPSTLYFSISGPPYLIQNQPKVLDTYLTVLNIWIPPHPKAETSLRLPAIQFPVFTFSVNFPVFPQLSQSTLRCGFVVRTVKGGLLTDEAEKRCAVPIVYSLRYEIYIKNGVELVDNAWNLLNWSSHLHIKFRELTSSSEEHEQNFGAVVKKFKII